MQKAVDKSWDAVFGGFSEDGNPPFTMSSNVTTEDVYDFDVVATMEIKSEKANGKPEPPIYMDMHFKENAQYMEPNFGGTRWYRLRVIFL